MSAIKAAPTRRERAGRMRYLPADKVCDTDRLRRSCAMPVPFRSSQAGAAASAPSATTGTGILVENTFGRLKDFGRVAIRHDRLAANVLSGAALAAASAFRPEWV